MRDKLGRFVKGRIYKMPEEVKRKIGKANKGKKRSEEVRERIRQTKIKQHIIPSNAFKKGHIPWNKDKGYPIAKLNPKLFKKGHKTWNVGLTKEIDSRVKGKKKFGGVKEISSLYGKNSITQIAEKFKCSPTTILSCLKKNKVKIKSQGFFNIGKKQSEETIRKRSLALIGRKPSKKAIARLIKMNLEDNPSKRPEIRAKLKVTRAKQVVPMRDSKIEIKIQNFLKRLGIEFFTHQYINIKHGYQCDILLPSINLVIECDGDYWHKYPIGLEKDHIRTKELIEKGFKVLRLWEFEINEMTIKQFEERLKNE